MFREETARTQGLLFSSLEDMVAPDSEVRALDMILEHVFHSMQSGYANGKGRSHVGRPAYSFQTLMRIFIYGYITRITGARSLEAECKRNIEMMWLTGNQSPDHNTISNFRKDHSAEIAAFSKELRLSLKNMKLIGDEYAIDGCKIKANLNSDNLFTLKALKAQQQHLEKNIKEYISLLAIADTHENISADTDSLLQKKEALTQELQYIDSMIELAIANGTNSYSPIDKDATFMKSRDGIIPAYNFQGSIDTTNKFSTSDDVTTDPADAHQLKPVVESIRSELELKEEEMTVSSDKGYFVIDDIQQIESTGLVKCYVAVPKITSPFRDKFVYDAENDRYICPEGKFLTSSKKQKHKGESSTRRYTCRECTNCPKKEQCCPKAKVGRSFARSFNEDFKTEFKERMKTPLAKEKLRTRRSTIECFFGTLKIRAGKIPLLTHGLEGVKTEVKLYCLAYNVKHLINLFTFEELNQMLCSISVKIPLFSKIKPFFCIFKLKKRNFFDFCGSFLISAELFLIWCNISKIFRQNLQSF